MPVTTQVRVRYAETDQMGIVYYANYLVWFEIGRVELLRSLGLAYSQLETDHQCILPVVEATCRYRSPARYDDEILIETRPSLLRGSVIKFGYRLLRKEKEGKEPTLLAEGETVHVVCDDQLNRKPLPAEHEAALRAIMER
jgi:acyl-CoA thioester hydrolase